MFDKAKVKRELMLIDSLPSWDRKQNDNWDGITRFIYDTIEYEQLLHKIEQAISSNRIPIEQADGFRAYALRRWYNFWTHEVVLDMFFSHPNVRPEENKTHKQIDFYLNEVPFDLKLTEFPSRFPHPLTEAQREPRLLIDWLYRNQSTQQRYHWANRLFVVCYDSTNTKLNWQVRREFNLISECIDRFMKNTENHIVSMHTDYRSAPIKSGIIFCIRTR